MSKASVKKSEKKLEMKKAVTPKAEVKKAEVKSDAPIDIGKRKGIMGNSQFNLGDIATSTSKRKKLLHAILTLTDAEVKAGKVVNVKEVFKGCENKFVMVADSLTAKYNKLCRLNDIPIRIKSDGQHVPTKKVKMAFNFTVSKIKA